MSPHLKLAHSYWAALLQPGDCVIDATCGNGHDTLFLAKLLLKENVQSQLYAVDIQSEAIEKTKEYLKKNIIDDIQRVKFIQTCHSNLPELPLESVTLIVYNLGYLPGSNKTITTMTKTTLESLAQAVTLIKPGGALSITCYPGHAEGKIEEEHILTWASTLSYLEWACCHHRWINRQNAPSLLFLQKISKNL